MIAYVLRRILQLLPVLLAASALIFAMIYAVPGGPVAVLVGENATQEQIAAVTEAFGLNKPVYVQYFDWLQRALVGDLGKSLHSREPVLKLIGERLPATLQLAVMAIVIGILIGVPVALASALSEGGWLDRLLSGWSALALGVPTFCFGCCRRRQPISRSGISPCRRCATRSCRHSPSAFMFPASSRASCAARW